MRAFDTMEAGSTRQQQEEDNAMTQTQSHHGLVPFGRVEAA
jgi:hypothetical protein